MLVSFGAFADRAAAEDARSRCAASNTHTLAANRIARVYEGPPEQRAFGHVVWGCLLRSGRVRTVASGGTAGAIKQVRLRKSVVGFAIVYCERYGGGCVSSLGTVALHSGARVRADPRPALSDITDLELRSRRQFAFIGRLVQGDRVVHVVYKRDAGGLVPLDQGTDIQPTSLRLIGPQITWTNAGADRAATFRRG